MLKVKDNVPVAKEEERRCWPFGEMKPGSVVDVDKKLWKRAQGTAHSVAHRKRWTIRTKWMGSFGRIRRVK
jgi:hypothetical protein